MKSLRVIMPLLVFLALSAVVAAQQQEKKGDSPPVMESGGKGKKAPEVWIDAKTGHRIFRLTPESGGSSAYFHDNVFTAESDKVVFTATGAGTVSVDLKALEQGVVKRETISKGGFVGVRTRPGTREVYVKGGGGVASDGADAGAKGAKGGKGGKGGGLTAVNLDTKATRNVDTKGGNLVNSDETTSEKAGGATDPSGNTPKPPVVKILPQRERMFADKIKAGIPLSKTDEDAAKKEDGLASGLKNPKLQAFTFFDMKTGQSKTTGFQYASLNHMQWNPIDPDYLLYAHEGTWHELDRVWIVKRDGSDQRLMHKRVMDMEIAGHEFWSRDGKLVWYDNQTPRSKDFWVKGVNIYNGERYAYHLTADEWGIHFNVADDNLHFASDGSNKGQVAYADNGRWIYSLVASVDEKMTKDRNEVIDGKQVHYGTFKSEKLVDMTNHGYSLEPGGSEPNVHISPDGKWVIFRTNMWGGSHVLAAEVAKWQK